jgi:hypothetical protein
MAPGEAARANKHGGGHDRGHHGATL